MFLIVPWLGRSFSNLEVPGSNPAVNIDFVWRQEYFSHIAERCMTMTMNDRIVIIIVIVIMCWYMSLNCPTCRQDCSVGKLKYEQNRFRDFSRTRWN